MATRFIALCGRLLAVFALASLVVAAPPAEARRLPPVDLAADAARSAAGDAGTEAALAPPGVSHDARVGAPAFLWGDAARAGLVAREGRPSPKRALEPAAAARAHLAELRDAYGLTADEVAALPLRQLQQLPDGAAIVRFGHAVDGVEVFREHANVLLDRERELVAVGGCAGGGAVGRSEARARAAARSRAGGRGGARRLQGFPAAIAASLQPAATRRRLRRLALPPGMRERRWLGARRSRSGPSPCGSATGAGLVPALLRRNTGAGRRVAAGHRQPRVRDRRRRRPLLYRHNQTADAAFTYRVYAEAGGANLPLPRPVGRNGFPHPTGTPDGYQAPLVRRQPRPLQNLPFSRNDPWLAARRDDDHRQQRRTRSRTSSRPTTSDRPDPNECNLGRAGRGRSARLRELAPRRSTIAYDPDAGARPPAGRRSWRR